MFKKALAHQSNVTPLRSSARRRLVTAIFEQYPSLRPSDDQTSEKDVAKAIVPEGVKSGTFETTAGFEGTMWFAPDGDPLWMSFGRNSKEYIPTLCLLALPLSSPPLPIIQIYNPVPPPLFTGAPLFLPAVRHLSRAHLLPDVGQDALVALATGEANGADVKYVGVGRVVAEGGVRGAAERRVKNIAQGREVDEGKFCEVLCIVDDHLWEMGSKPLLQTFKLPAPSRPLGPPTQPEAGPSRPSSPRSGLANGVKNLAIDSDTSSSSPAPVKPSSTLSPTDVSTLLSLALIQVLSTSPPSFPLPASLLYSAHILPHRPGYIPKEQRDDVIIAKSEWKKLTKWMKEAAKEGLLKIKESKGEMTVQGFDARHPSLISHVEFVTIAQEEVKAAKKAARESTNEEPSMSAGKGKGKEIAIAELWKPGSGGAAFWEAAGVDKATPQHTGVLKAAFEEYINKHDLVDPREHRFVVLDEELGRAVGVKKIEPGERMMRDEALRRLRSGVVWSVSIDGVVRKGALQPVTMTVKTRQGRKTVTLIGGLETFGVDVDEFAEELRTLCAGSASVQPLQGASPKLNLREIMVQGSQTRVVTEALLAKGVRKRWIKEAEGDQKKTK